MAIWAGSFQDSLTLIRVYMPWMEIKLDWLFLGLSDPSCVMINIFLPTKLKPSYSILQWTTLTLSQSTTSLFLFFRWQLSHQNQESWHKQVFACVLMYSLESLHLSCNSKIIKKTLKTKTWFFHNLVEIKETVIQRLQNS